MNTAAFVVAANDNVLHLQAKHRKFEHTLAARIFGLHDIGDVSVDEDFARRGASNLTYRHAAVGAADPKILGMLLGG